MKFKSFIAVIALALLPLAAFSQSSIPGALTIGSSGTNANLIVNGTAEVNTLLVGGTNRGGGISSPLNLILTGTGVLTSGTAFIENSAITTGTYTIFAQETVLSGVPAPRSLAVIAQSVGSATIVSGTTADNSSFTWLILSP